MKAAPAQAPPSPARSLIAALPTKSVSFRHDKMLGMTGPLTLATVVDTLVEMDLVDLDGTGPWPGEPDAADVYEPDWSQVHPTNTGTVFSTDMPLGLPPVFDELRRRSEKGFLVPPPDVLDALAWYTPIHYFGLGSAIYIREQAVFDVAVAILNRLPDPDRFDEQNMLGASRAAMSLLYLHEAFHHKIESLSIRYEIVERQRRYLPYMDNVAIPLLEKRSDAVLEETLACAEMYRRFKSEKIYRHGVPVTVRKATLDMLPDWFIDLPPSYDQAGEYLQDTKFDGALATLMGQLHEATASPTRNPSEWALAPQMHRGLFNCQNITHVLVPVGQTPLLPWIGHIPALQSISTRKMIRLLEKRGWEIAAGRGKGSHIRMTYPGKLPLTIPANRESISPIVRKSIAQTLGVRVTDLRP